jgi:porphobilinogen synthase
MRRKRRTGWMREMLAEYRLSPSDLVLPLFVQEGKGLVTPIASMQGVNRYTIDTLIPVIKEAKARGIPAVALFPVTPSERKTEDGREAYGSGNLICRTVLAVKEQVEDIGVICDVALDPYTTHGQDGVIGVDGLVDNDRTVDILVKQALVQAASGCDIIAPSDMMDGRVGVIRRALDEQGYSHVAILSYAAKYASAFYGPFRDAVGSAGNLGKKGKHDYQMDFRNSDEALHEVALDLQEGADMVMVKPGMPYLDIISRIKREFGVPVFAYQVSGEYAMLSGAENPEAVMDESLLCFKRAGADVILTYAALEVAGRL